MSLPRNDPRHGTENGYKNLGCRCARCRDAHSVAYRERAHRLGYTEPRADYLADKQRRAWEKPCGTETKWQYGCRCNDCTQASRAARARRRAKTSSIQQP